MKPTNPDLSRRQLLGAAALLPLGTAAFAQAPAAPAAAWPTKPVRLVVAFPAGGLADVMARLLQPALQEALGQPVLIDNRGGANGNLAADAVLKAGDGHSFLVSSTGVESVNPLLYPKMTFDPARDLVHVALLANTQLFLATRGNLPPNTLKEFVAYAKSQPGKLSYGSAGPASTPHLAGELLKQNAGLFVTHLPYRGIAPMLQDLVAGQIDYGFVPGTAFPYVRSGKLKLLAVASPRRTANWPSAPTFAEEGFGQVYADTLFGVWAPAGTPPEVVSRLNRELNKPLATAAVKQRFAELGGEALPLSPAEFKALVAAETKLFGAVIKARHITAD